MTVIEQLLKQQNELLIRQNERLLLVLEAFANRDTNVVVNSYNGSSAYADNNSKTTSKADAHSSSNNTRGGTDIAIGDANAIAHENGIIGDANAIGHENGIEK